MLEDAYVLCVEGRIERVGRMRDLGRLEQDVEELDGRGLAAVPGLVDCHTHACFAGDRARSSRCAPAARATRSCMRPAAGSCRRSAPRGGRGGRARRRRSGATAAGCCGGTTTFEAKSGYGLDRDTELASLRAIAAEGGIPTYLGLHAVPPEYDDAEAYVDFVVAEVLPQAAELAEAADVFLERGAFDAVQARRYLEAARDHGLALRLHADQFTEAGGVELAIELGARSVDHLEATGERGVAALAQSEVTAVLLPASALFLGRPMPPGRALVEAGAAVALATDFNPGSAFCESLPVVASLASTQLGLSPAQALSAMTVNAAHVLGQADRKGRLAPGYDADLVLLDAADWRHLAYHLGGDLVAAVIAGGRVAWRRYASPDAQ